MSALAHEVAAVEVWCDDDDLWVRLADGRRVSVPLAYYPRLLHATAEQRKNFELGDGGRGIHWPDVDEDLSVEGIILGIPDQTRDGRQHRKAS